jgi:hypothetical protein
VRRAESWTSCAASPGGTATTDWTQISDIGPDPRAGHGLAYDSDRQRVALFGGDSGGTLRNDTWEWDGTDWTQAADTGPDQRHEHGLAYDTSRGRLILFGGEAAGQALRNDTWGWDGSAWTQIQEVGPAARRGHALAFDSARERIVLFGGDTGVGPANDSWEWDGASWTQVQDIGPDPLLGGAMVFDGEAILLFGGVASASATTPPPVLFGVSWEWSGNGWTARQDMGPSPRWGHAMAFDSDRGRPVLFGGFSVPPADATVATSVLADTWEATVTTTTPAQPGGPGASAIKIATVTLVPDAVPMGGDTTAVVTLTGPAIEPTEVGIFVIVDSHAGIDLRPSIVIPVGETQGQALLDNLPGPGPVVIGARLGGNSRTAILHVIAP